MKWVKVPKLAMALLVLLLILVSAGSGSADNLLVNSDFRALDGEGLPDGWFRDAYIQEPGYSAFSVSEEMVDGASRSVLMIQNFALNDARLAQSVTVEPESLYHFSALVRTDSVEQGHGANLSVEGLYAFSEELFDTEGGWQRLDWYGETGPDQTDVTLFLRLGGYSGESLGKAWFTDPQLEKVTAVPGDLVAARWFKTAQPAVYEDEEEDTVGASAWPWLALIAAVYALAACGLAGWMLRLQTDRPEPLQAVGPDRLVAAGLVAALLVRLVISFLVEGYMVDVNCFLGWGGTMASSGAARFYETVSFCDYPPAYLLVLGLNARLVSLTGAVGGWVRVIYRFVPCLCDVLGCGALYAVARREDGRRGLSALLCVLLALNPVGIMNSAAWGQMDSVLCFLLLLVAVGAVRGRWIWALPCYMLAVLVKPQALMLGPLGLIALLSAWIRKREERKPMLIGLGISLTEALIILLLFRGYQEPGWIIRLYGDTLSSYPYATVNTANFYYLLGGNWNGIQNASAPLADALLAALCFGYGAFWTLKARGKARLWQLETVFAGAFGLWFVLCAVLGWSWVFTGAAAMVFAFVVVLSLYFRKGDIRFLPFAGALLFILLYVFGIKMHERYLFPAFLLLGLAWVLSRDRRLLGLGLVFSLCVFLNEGIVLDNSLRLGSAMGHLNQDTVWLADLLSVVQILGALFAVRLGVGHVLGEPVPEAAASAFPGVPRVGSSRSPLTFRPDSSLHWTLRDTLLMFLVTGVFALVSLTTLGSTKAPQTVWTSSSYDEEIILDLGEDHPPAWMLYFAQVSMYDFSLSQSDDEVNWSEEVWAQMNQAQCWKWKYVTESYVNAKGEREYYNSGYSHILRFTCRYVRIIPHQVGLKLNEVVFRAEDGTLLPVKRIGRRGGNPESELYSDTLALTDEQHTLEGLPLLPAGQGEDSDQPSWWNSTYFDEIYHARTGYEFLKGTAPYETTHPPLGKVLISWGIALFGMTPFGWRFAGALAGILMIPGMYLLGKQLTKKTAWAFLCALLMALDCQHLTQTQIATIDSFPVLFIIFAYFFMLRFLQTDLLRAKKAGILANLAGSGLFMGLSIASKWIGIYAGAGLGVLFFWHCGRQILLCRQAAALSAAGDLTQAEREWLAPWLPADAEKGGNPGVRKTAELCLWCLLFFVAVPLAVYVASYVPYMAYNHAIRSFTDYLKAVWQAQINMLNYHSTKELGMDHPFYSPWWQWPIIGKPMYYASESYELEGGLYHSIFCFGNPVVWYGGLAGLAGCLGAWIVGKRYRLEKDSRVWHWMRADYQNAAAFILLSFLAQYLPWTLVPRGTYIYHYFASVPFLILSVIFCLSAGGEKHHALRRAAAWIIGGLAAVGFLVFFPYASGIMAPAWWLDIGSKILRIWY